MFLQSSTKKTLLGALAFTLTLACSGCQSGGDAPPNNNTSTGSTGGNTPHDPTPWTPGNNQTSNTSNEWALSSAGSGEVLYQQNNIAGVQITTDKDKNIYLAGNFSNQIDLGLGTIVGETQDIFLLKIGSDHKPIWAKRFAGNGLQRVASIAADSAGNIIVAGSFLGSVTIGSNSFVTNGPGWDVFIAKIGSDGEAVWAKSFGQDENNEDLTAIAVVVDNQDRIAFTGHFKGHANFTNVGLSNTSTSTQIFLVQFDKDGQPTWDKNLKGYAPTALAIDGDRIILAGRFFPQDGNSIDFGNATLTCPSGERCTMFLAKLDSAGSHLWSHEIGGTSANSPNVAQQINSVAVDGAGNIIIGGAFNYTIEFLANNIALSAMSNTYKQDAFLVKFSDSGTPIWGKSFGDSQKDELISSVATDANGNVFFTGYSGYYELFVSDVNQNGDTVWMKSFGDPQNSALGTDIAVVDSNVLVTGSFMNSLNLDSEKLGVLPAGGLSSLFLINLVD